jgi:EAL and modified HD-GYP domain-containing signal transduction protein
MATGVDSRTVLCVARQPILNRARRVYGYELLYRDVPSATECEGGASNIASSRVLTDAVLAVGLDRLTAGKPAFVNFTRSLLMSGAGILLPPAAMVIEILESVEVDKDVVRVCRQLRARGYALALDDFVPGSSAEQLVPHAKFVKVDVLSTPLNERIKLAARLKPLGIRLIAEKVETEEMAESCLGQGYTLLQGYHFCRPTTFNARAMPARRIAHMRLFAALSQDDLSIDKLEDLVKHDVSLSYKVLRSINSAAHGIHREVTSVRQALVLLGLDYIRKWASVWALAGLNDGGTEETVAVALLRARCCELLDAAGGGADNGQASFLLGLCSLLDVISGRPMLEVLEEMPLSNSTREALLGGVNPDRARLDAVIAYERGEWERAYGLLATLGLPEIALPNAYAEALRWTRELSHGPESPR